MIHIQNWNDYNEQGSVKEIKFLWLKYVAYSCFALQKNLKGNNLIASSTFQKPWNISIR